ncbi:MAG: LLM class flavin-dependent oxidoreductase [Verrucomicrobium sp.]|nr:LLM class flavin-dependent oxidoreductase [Verrucomicrobium sp.]
MADLSLSVLDQSIAVAGRGQDVSIRETIEMARRCEELGYRRFWVSEHHNLDSIAGSAPEVLIAAIAATTRRIRVGSAGVLLPHYSSLKVAEQFRVLEAIAPGRIDLGVGRAPGGDMKTARALNPDFPGAGDAFPAQMDDLLNWVAGLPLAKDHPFHGVKALPEGPFTPEVWMLGSTTDGARLAARFGLPFCLAHFISEGRGAEEAFEDYHRLYQPSARHPRPYASVCVWALAAETEEKARHLFRTRERWRLNRDRGVFGPLVSPEEAAAEPRTRQEEEYLERLREGALIGTPARVGRRLREMAAAWKLDEAAILTWTHDPAARARSYALFAEEFKLAGSSAASP